MTTTDDRNSARMASSTTAAGALYDNLLQSALQQFFVRAEIHLEGTPSPADDSRLAIDVLEDRSEVTIRWFGVRHTLRADARRPFTPHEIRFARAIGAVLAARYRAIFDPRLMAERGDLFRGSIEDRFVGAFLDEAPYRIQAQQNRADRIAGAIDVLRVAALSRYENREISSGVLLLDSDENPARSGRPLPAISRPYSEMLTEVRSFYRLCDGLRTLFLVNRRGGVFDIAEIERWAETVRGGRALPVPCAQPYRAHARATLDSRHVCIVLTPSHEIRVFAGGAHVFTFRNARWHLLDLAAKYGIWASAVGNPALAARLFDTALDLADAREGTLFVVLRDPAAAVPELIGAPDRLEQFVESGQTVGAPSRRELLYLLAERNLTELDPSLVAALARLDGATVTDTSGRLLAAGAILLHPVRIGGRAGLVGDGARTTAALAACRFGPVLKVSADGIISFYDRDKVWDI